MCLFSSQGELTDGMDIFEHVMTRGNVMPRLNARVLNPSENYIDFTHKESGISVRGVSTFLHSCHINIIT